MGLDCCSYDKNNNNHQLFSRTSQALCSVGNTHKLPKFPPVHQIPWQRGDLALSMNHISKKKDLAGIQTIGRDI